MAQKKMTGAPALLAHIVDESIRASNRRAVHIEGDGALRVEFTDRLCCRHSCRASSDNDIF